MNTKIVPHSSCTRLANCLFVMPPRNQTHRLRIVMKTLELLPSSQTAPMLLSRNALLVSIVVAAAVFLAMGCGGRSPSGVDGGGADATMLDAGTDVLDAGDGEDSAVADGGLLGETYSSVQAAEGGGCAVRERDGALVCWSGSTPYEVSGVLGVRLLAMSGGASIGINLYHDRTTGADTFTFSTYGGGVVCVQTTVGRTMCWNGIPLNEFVGSSPAFDRADLPPFDLILPGGSWLGSGGVAIFGLRAEGGVMFVNRDEPPVELEVPAGERVIRIADAPSFVGGSYGFYSIIGVTDTGKLLRWRPDFIPRSYTIVRDAGVLDVAYSTVSCSGYAVSHETVAGVDLCVLLNDGAVECQHMVVTSDTRSSVEPGFLPVVSLTPDPTATRLVGGGMGFCRLGATPICWGYLVAPATSCPSYPWIEVPIYLEGGEWSAPWPDVPLPAPMNTAVVHGAVACTINAGHPICTRFGMVSATAEFSPWSMPPDECR